MNNQNLIPGAHKLTDEERRRGQAKGIETRRRKKSLRKLVRMVAELEAPAEVRKLMTSLGIEEDEQTILMGIVVTAGINGALGDKDARRDFIRYYGEDPEEVRKDKELALKEKEAERKNPEEDQSVTIFEQMVRERHERAHKEAD